MTPSTSRGVMRRNQHAYRLRKRRGGYCIYGGCWEHVRDGMLRCPEHRAVQAGYSKRYREKAKGA